MRFLKLVLALISAVFILPVCGQTYEEINQVYPISENNGQRVITGFQEFSGLNDEQIYANALKWAINEYCKERRDGLSEVQAIKKSFSYAASHDYIVEGKTKYTFQYKADIKAIDGKLVYTLYDVFYRANGFLPFSSSSHIDKLNPEKKSKHKDILKAFEEVASHKLNILFDAIVANLCAPISHWSDINIQRPVKGMNEDECYLALGKPGTNYEDNNNRIQWSYGLNLILIFKAGKLETIIR